MSVDITENRIQETRDFYVDRAAELMHDTARYGQQVARSEVRRRSDDLADSVEVWPSDEGLTQDMGTMLQYGIYNEFGTGIYAEGQSSADELPWVYYDEYLGQFFTTYGLKPQPFIRPGFDAAENYLLGNARRYFS